MARISEEQLILPSLYLMDNLPRKTITTTELKEKLITIFKPTGDDAKIAPSRGTDSLFTQKVRNLKSHDTLENLGYAIYNEKVGGARSGSFTLTDSGMKYLEENINVVNYLLNNDFSSNDLKEAFDTVYANKNRATSIETFDENVTINEGSGKFVISKVYERSITLRNIAIEHYSYNGRIKCRACCFDFEEFYGLYGKGFIEIHHQKPVFMFAGEDFERKIEEALANVIPVCPNCHRMIHRKRDNPLQLDEIKNIVSRELTFCK